MEKADKKMYNDLKTERRVIMLFNKDIEACCSYCTHGNRINETDVACIKRGIVSSGGSCGKFRYDPLKRAPAKPVSLDTDKYSQKDFEI